MICFAGTTLLVVGATLMAAIPFLIAEHEQRQRLRAIVKSLDEQVSRS